MVTITVAIAVVVFFSKKTNALFNVILFRYVSTISAIGEHKVVIIPIGLRTCALSFSREFVYYGVLVFAPSSTEMMRRRETSFVRKLEMMRIPDGWPVITSFRVTSVDSLLKKTLPEPFRAKLDEEQIRNFSGQNLTANKSGTFLVKT